MRKITIIPLLLCCTELLAQSEILSPGLRLGPSARIAPFSFGPRTEGLELVVQNGSSFVAYTQTAAGPVSTPVSASGVPDLNRRTLVTSKESARVVVSAGRLLVVWSESQSVYAARLDETGALSTVNRVGSGGLLSLTCAQDECIFAFGTHPNTYVVTDSEGQPLASPVALPTCCRGFDGVSSITANSTGFILFRFGGYVSPDHLVKVDLGGRIAFDVSPPFSPIAVIPVDDRVVLITDHLWNVVDTQGIISATDLQLSGGFGPPRPLIMKQGSVVRIYEHASGTQLALLEGQHATLFDLDPKVTTATIAREFDIPAQDSLVEVVSNGTFSIGFLSTAEGVLFTMPLTVVPTLSLLSYGALPQRADAIIDDGAEYVVAWSEFGSETATLRATKINHSSVMLKTTELVRSRLGVNNVSMANIGDDVLVAWTDPLLRGSSAAILRADDIVVPVDLGGTFFARTVIARADDWVIIADDFNAIRVSRKGVADPPKSIGFGSFLDADSDGTRILILSADLLLGPDLTVERRMPPVGSAVAFSGDSYLVAGDDRVTRIDRKGETFSSTPLAPNAFQQVAATARGWLLLNSSTGALAEVLPQNPPFVTSSLTLSGITAIAKHGSDRVGLLFTPIDESAAAPSVVFRELELFTTPRRRSIPSR